MERTMIKTELLCKSFLNDGEVNHVIKNMNLEILEGDFTVIMGSSGSGKSTLIYTLSGMMEATEGEVYLNGMDITGVSEKKLAVIRREKIGFVFQNMNLIPDLTVYENILSPAYQNKKGQSNIIRRAELLLEQMNMKESRNKFPNQLSGGQKQRAAICRAIINEPDILFADEPTGALNSSQGEHVLDIFTEMFEKGQTVVMVTHDLKAALRGNRIIFLKDGRIDGDLRLDSFHKSNIIKREAYLYEFLKERGW